LKAVSVFYVSFTCRQRASEPCGLADRSCNRTPASHEAPRMAAHTRSHVLHGFGLLNPCAF